MPIKLVCINAFHGVPKGTTITDPEQVQAHLARRPHHFVKVTMTEAEAAALASSAAASAAAKAVN